MPCPRTTVDTLAVGAATALVFAVATAVYKPCLESGREFLSLDDGENFLHEHAVELDRASLRWLLVDGVVLGTREPLASVVKLGVVRGDVGTALQVNVLLHALNASFACALSWRLVQQNQEVVRGSMTAAAANMVAALATSLHPVCVEAVAWCSCQPVLLAAWFSLVGAHLHLNGHGFASAALLACACLCKATSVSVPLAFILYVACDYVVCAGNNPGAISYRPLRCVAAVCWQRLDLIAVSLLGIALATAASLDDPDPGRRPVELHERGLRGICAPFFYLYKLGRPVGLSTRYLLPHDAPLSSSELSVGIPATAAILMHSGALLWWLHGPSTTSCSRIRYRICSCWLGWCLLLLPTLGLLSSHATDLFAADRYVYIPLMLLGTPCLGGLLTSMAVRALQAVDDGRRGGSACAATLACCVGVLLLSGGLGLLGRLTFDLQDVWTNDRALYRHMLIHNPNDLLAHNNNAAWLQRAGRLTEAVAAYDELLALEPKHARGATYK